MIIYRFFFKWLDGKHEAATANWRKTWNETENSLDSETLKTTLKIIHSNDFTNIDSVSNNKQANDLLKFYTNYRNEINKPNTELYKLKQEYNANPTRKWKRKIG
jgi:hypothetical protein